MRDLVPQIEPQVEVDIEERLVRLTVGELIPGPPAGKAGTFVQGSEWKIQARNGVVDTPLIGVEKGDVVGEFPRSDQLKIGVEANCEVLASLEKIVVGVIHSDSCSESVA